MASSDGLSASCSRRSSASLLESDDSGGILQEGLLLGAGFVASEDQPNQLLFARKLLTPDVVDSEWEGSVELSTWALTLDIHWQETSISRVFGFLKPQTTGFWNPETSFRRYFGC